MKQLHLRKPVVDNTAELNLFLLWAIYDAFGKKGDRVVWIFRADIISKEFEPKLVQLVSGNLEDIKYMYDEDIGNLDSVLLPERPS